MEDEKELPAGTGTRRAMDDLKARYPVHVAWGMHYAVKIALRKLTVHSQEVLDELIRDGIITGEGKVFWLGAVFRELKEKGVLLKTIHQHKYANEARNVHERLIFLWQINDKADLTDYRLPPKERP